MRKHVLFPLVSILLAGCPVYTGDGSFAVCALDLDDDSYGDSSSVETFVGSWSCPDGYVDNGGDFCDGDSTAWKKADCADESDADADSDSDADADADADSDADADPACTVADLGLTFEASSSWPSGYEIDYSCFVVGGHTYINAGFEFETSGGTSWYYSFENGWDSSVQCTSSGIWRDSTGSVVTFSAVSYACEASSDPIGCTNTADLTTVGGCDGLADEEDE